MHVFRLYILQRLENINSLKVVSFVVALTHFATANVIKTIKNTLFRIIAFLPI